MGAIVNDFSGIRFRPSAAPRWTQCPASLVLEGKLKPVEEPSVYADEGARLHKIMEWLLLSFSGNHRSMLPEAAISNDDMIIIQDALRLSEKYRNFSHKREHIEQFIYDDFDVRGTDVAVRLGGSPDYFVLHGTGGNDEKYWKDATIIDWKMGVNPVNAAGNLQLAIYAYLLFKNYEHLERINTVIVQPRSLSLANNGVTEAGYTREDAEDIFKIRVLPAIEAVMQGKAVYKPSPEACRYCPVKLSCGALGKHLQRELRENTQINLLAPGQLAELRAACDLAYNMRRQLDDHLLLLMQSGAEVPGLEIGETRAGNRKWDDEEAVERVLVDRYTGQEMRNFYKPQELKTPTQLEKVSPAAYKLVEDRVTKEPPRPKVEYSAEFKKTILKERQERIAALFSEKPPSLEKDHGSANATETTEG